MPRNKSASPPIKPTANNSGRASASPRSRRQFARPPAARCRSIRLWLKCSIWKHFTSRNNPMLSWSKAIAVSACCVPDRTSLRKYAATCPPITHRISASRRKLAANQKFTSRIKASSRTNMTG